MEEPSRSGAIRVLPSGIESLHQELQGPHPITLGNLDIASTFSLRPAVELACHDDAEVERIVQVRPGGSIKKPPGVLVKLDELFPQSINLVAPSQLDQTLDRVLQVRACPLRVLLAIEDQPAITLKGFFVVSLFDECGQPRPQVGWFAVPGDGGRDGKNDARTNHHGNQAKKIHGNLGRYKQPRIRGQTARRSSV